MWHRETMIKASIESTGKGWFVGPWHSGLAIAVGYSDRGVNEPHTHDVMSEIYVVASGTSTAIVAGLRIELSAGDLLVVEPGEEHTFDGSSADYIHYVIQTPAVTGDRRLANL